MPLAPDLPFPKSPGDAIRSKDWNDLVIETQRLDNAKVNRAGDAITGPLTIAGALALGTTTAAAKLHVVDSNTPAALRIQSTRSFGQAQLEFWSDPQGSATEWRPGVIQSLDTNPGNFTGGLSFLTNGPGAGKRAAPVEAMRIVNGNVGISNPAPTVRLDVAGAIRSQNLFGYRSFKIEVGQSSPTDWKVYNLNGIYVDVNTSAAGFSEIPRYITALHGTGSHWATTGGSSVYSPMPTGFRIYIQWADRSPLAPAFAQANGWYIQWIGIQS